MNEDDFKEFRKALPPLHRAMALRQSYYDHVSWRYDPIAPDELDSDVFRMFYDLSGAMASSTPTPLATRAYRLATMFMVLALGEALFSESLGPATNDLDYYNIALTLLLRSPVLEDPTLEALQVLVWCIFLMKIHLFILMFRTS
jgi:hypothetical protein